MLSLLLSLLGSRLSAGHFSGRLGHSLVKRVIVVLAHLLKQEVGGKLLVLIAGEVRLRCLVLAEAQGHQALDRFHLLLAYAHDALVGVAGLAALGHASLGHTTLRASTSTSSFASHDKVHKSHGVLLNYLV